MFFNPRTALSLKKYLLERGKPEIDALFINSKKPYNRIGKRSIEKEIEIIATNAGLDKHVYPHLIRHTMATLGFSSGMALTTIQHLLGHTDPSTTQIYAEIDMSTVREEYRRHMAQ